MNEEKSVLYRTIARMIQRGRTEGLSKKINIFYAAGELTDEEFQELTAALSA